MLNPRHGGSFVTLAQHKHITRKSSQRRKKTADTVGMPGVDARGHLGMSDAGDGGSHSICYSTWMKGSPGLKPSLEYLGFKPFLPLF